MKEATGILVSLAIVGIAGTWIWSTVKDNERKDRAVQAMIDGRMRLATTTVEEKKTGNT